MIECDENKSIVVDGVTYYKPIKKESLTGWEEPEEDDEFWCLSAKNDEGFNYCARYSEDWATDKILVNNAAAFKNEDFAEQYARHETLWRRIAKWQALNDKPTIATNVKWSICFNYASKEIEILRYFHTLVGNTVEFSSKEKCAECIEAFKKDLEWDMNEFKWRLDGE